MVSYDKDMKFKHRPRRTTEEEWVKLPPEAMAAMRRQLEAFEAKFGRKPGPDDPVFFDPDADTPVQISKEKVTAELERAMRVAGIDEARIYATRKTGLMPFPGAVAQWTVKDRADWNAALDEYHRAQGRAKSAERNP